MNEPVTLLMTEPTQGRAHNRLHSRMHSRKRVAGALAAAMAGLLLAGLAACGGTGPGASSSSGGAPAIGSVNEGAGGSAAEPLASGAKAAAGGDAADAGGSASGSAGAGDTIASAALLQQRQLILDTSLSLTVKNVVQAAGRVRALASAAGGYVGDEKTSGAASLRTAESFLTLRIPATKLADVTDQVSTLGTVDSRTESSDDVTQKSVDVTSRLATQRASVARIRTLLTHATKISDIVLIEGELSSRESNLESLEAQLKNLDDSVQLATLSVELSPPGVVVKKPAKAHSGFVAGLGHGWSAFVTALVAGLTVLGAVLPFVVLLAVIAGVVVVTRRRWTIRRAENATP